MYYWIDYETNEVGICSVAPPWMWTRQPPGYIRANIVWNYHNKRWFTFAASSNSKGEWTHFRTPRPSHIDHVPKKIKLLLLLTDS